MSTVILGSTVGAGGLVGGIGSYKAFETLYSFLTNADLDQLECVIIKLVLDNKIITIDGDRYVVNTEIGDRLIPTIF